MKEKFTDKSLDYLFATDETETQELPEEAIDHTEEIRES